MLFTVVLAIPNLLLAFKLFMEREREKKIDYASFETQEDSRIGKILTRLQSVLPPLLIYHLTENFWKVEFYCKSPKSIAER